MPSSRTKRRLGSISLVLALVVTVTVGVRQSVAQVYRVPVGAMEPEIPTGARILVYKLAGSYAPGDIVAYRHSSGQTWLGRVEAVQADGGLTLSRNAGDTVKIGQGEIIGRVVLTTR